MDLAAHHVLERAVYEALPLHGAPAVELGRDDDGAKVATPFPGAGMTHVKVTLVDDFYMDRGEPLAQLGLDAAFRRLVTMDLPARFAIVAA